MGARMTSTCICLLFDGLLNVAALGPSLSLSLVLVLVVTVWKS